MKNESKKYKSLFCTSLNLHYLCSKVLVMQTDIRRLHEKGIRLESGTVPATVSLLEILKESLPLFSFEWEGVSK